MGRNRKFVLKDDLQQAVWRTILRGPRPPSAKWGRSSPANSKPGPVKQAQSGKEVRGEGTEAVWSVFDDTPGFPFTRRSDGRCTQLSGEAPIRSCLFGRRRRSIGDNQGRSPESRGPGARASPDRETCRAGTSGRDRGARRASVQVEFNRSQSVIEGLQKELSAFWSGHAVHFSGVENDDDMVVDLRHKKSKVGPKTPLAITGAAPATPPFFNGDSHQFRSVSGVSST